MSKRIVFILSILMILMPAMVMAAGTYTIYTWGYMDIMKSMLEAVTSFMGTKNFAMMFKVAMLLSAFTIFLSLLSDKGFSPALIFQKILLVIGLQTFLFSPVATMNIVIEDKSGNNIMGAGTSIDYVDDVPAVVGFPLYLLSQLEYGTRQAFRNSLSNAALKSGIGDLEDVSIITALNAFNSANDIRINNPNFLKSFHSYMENCVLPDIVGGYLDIAYLTTTSDLWTYITDDPHITRIGSWYMNDDYQGIDGEIMTCNKLAIALTYELDTVTETAQTQIKAGLGLSADIDLNSMIGGVSSFINNYNNSQDVILSAATMNLFNDSYEAIAGGMGISDTGLAYGMARAQETARMNAAMQGIMAKKYMPVAKGYLTVIFVALIPLVIIIALVTSSFKKPFAMIFGMLIALALWNIGDQLLDFIIIVRTFTLLGNEGISGYNLATQTFISSSISDILTLSLGMYWMIPTLAFSVATLSGYGAAAMMGGISGAVTSGVGMAASEAASGSMALGNVRMNNINMNKYDAASSLSVGSSAKMSLDMQQTASNQGSVLTGQQNIWDNKDLISHTGSTHLFSPDGKHYEINGTTEITSAGLRATGAMIQEYDKDGNLLRSWKGDITAAGNMNSYKENAIRNASGTDYEAAYMATEIVDTKFSAGHEQHEDYKKTQDYLDSQKTEINRSYTYNASHNEDTSKNINASYNYNDSQNTTTGSEYTNKGTTETYKNAYNGVMNGAFAGDLEGFYQDYLKVQNGEMDKAQLEARVMNFSKQVSGDMPVDLIKNVNFGQSSGSSQSQGTSSEVSSIDTLSANISGNLGNGKGASAGGQYSHSVSSKEAVTENIQNTKDFTQSKGGATKEDMMAKQLTNDLMNNMKQLHKQGMGANEGAGAILSGTTAQFVNTKTAKPF